MMETFEASRTPMGRPGVESTIGTHPPGPPVRVSSEEFRAAVLAGEPDNGAGAARREERSRPPAPTVLAFLGHEIACAGCWHWPGFVVRARPFDWSRDG